jgi:hypothetical protein
MYEKGSRLLFGVTSRERRVAIGETSSTTQWEASACITDQIFKLTETGSVRAIPGNCLKNKWLRPGFVARHSC